MYRIDLAEIDSNTPFDANVRAFSLRYTSLARSHLPAGEPPPDDPPQPEKEPDKDPPVIEPPETDPPVKEPPPQDPATFSDIERCRASTAQR